MMWAARTLEATAHQGVQCCAQCRTSWKYRSKLPVAEDLPGIMWSGVENQLEPIRDVIGSRGQDGCAKGHMYSVLYL